jgi:signal transduction histidine kinase
MGATSKPAASGPSSSWKALLDGLRTLVHRDGVVRLTLVLASVSAFAVVAFPAVRSALGMRLVTTLFLLLVVLAIRRGLSRVRARAEVRFWNELSLASGIWLAGDLLLIWTLFVAQPSWIDVVVRYSFAFYYVLLVLAVEGQPHRREGETADIVRRLNLPAVSLFIFGLFAYFLLIPVTLHEGYDYWEWWSRLSVTIDLFLVARLLYLCRTVRSLRWQSLYLLLAAVVGALLVADSITAVSTANYVYVLSLILLIFAARLKEHDFYLDAAVPEDRSEELSGRTMAYALAFPLIHLVIYRYEVLDVFDAMSRDLREIFVLVWSLLLGTLAILQHHLLEKTKARLEQGNLRLQSELATRQQLGQERERFIDELQHKNVELGRFTYAASHDLKSPLITIEGFAGMLQVDLAEKKTESVSSDLEYIRSAARTMREQLEELLRLSRAGGELSEPQEVEVADLVGDALIMVAGEIEERGVTVEVSPQLGVVFGDRARLLQVFHNLIDNAVKFMGPQVAPRIDVGVRDDEGEPIYFVQDNGVGIDKGHHLSVFELFDRLDSASASGGSGVGLALVKRVIDSHGGRVWVESEGEGRGSTICFTLSPYPFEEQRL